MSKREFVMWIFFSLIAALVGGLSVVIGVTDLFNSNSVSGALLFSGGLGYCVLSAFIFRGSVKDWFEQ